MKKPKITIVGAGNVGASAAVWAAAKELGDIVLVDIIDGMPQGKALDLMETGPVEHFDTKIVGTNNFEDSSNSDVVIVTSGMARKPGMSRDDLVDANLNIVKPVSEQVAKYSPNCILMMVANPLDVMTWLAKQITGFPKHRVFGMAGFLDTARFRA